MNSPDHEGNQLHRPAPVVLVGISGGVAAYKSVDLVSRLKKKGYAVHVLMTEAATRFVTPLTFEAVSGHQVFASVFPEKSAEHAEQVYPHLYPATRADAMVVAPATADVIARLAHGLGNDVVTTSALSLPPRCRRFFAPAMNVEMWHQPVVQENVARLEKMGWIRIGPEAGELACGMVGEGRMKEPAELADVIARELEGINNPPLAGRQVLVLSGPTCEYLDPVRFISNASSGKMGKALAEQAARLGAQVQLVTGPVADSHLPQDRAISVHRITSAEELLKQAGALYDDCHVIIYAAAVADYRPVHRNHEKMPKSGEAFSLALEPTPDVAATLNRRKKPGQIAIGFALQTVDGEKNALKKMQAKQFDGIVLNYPDALGGNEGTYTFYAADGTAQNWDRLSKADCSRRILEFAANALGVKRAS